MKDMDLFGVKILVYHSVGGAPKDHKLGIRVTVDNFNHQMQLLAGGDYVVIGLSDFIDNNYSPSTKRPVILTFDDGYKDNISNAAPILERQGFKATFFITTSYIDALSDKKWTSGLPREYMTWDDVIKLSDMGFEIGSHMVDHVDLTSLDDDRIRVQMKKSKEVISKHIGKTVLFLSYPYGKVDGRVREAAKECGYRACCSLLPGLNGLSDDRFLLRRTEINGNDNINDFELKLRKAR